MARPPQEQHLPQPPLELVNRVGAPPADEDPFDLYVDVGRRSRDGILSLLRSDWSFEGTRVLDFGCGVGRTLRHFAAEAERGEFWGCDIDAESIEWMQAHLSPPFSVLHNADRPPLPFRDGYFDLIWCVSVFTHLTDSWSDWLLELRRVLRDGGLMIATFMGEGMTELILNEPWPGDRVGMNIRRLGQSWELGGPMVLHSPWWLREHWGRAFDVDDIRVRGFGKPEPSGQGSVLLRKNTARVSRDDLERVDAGDVREVVGLLYNVETMSDEIRQLRHDVEWLQGELQKAAAESA